MASRTFFISANPDQYKALLLNPKLNVPCSARGNKDGPPQRRGLPTPFTAP